MLESHLIGRPGVLTVPLPGNICSPANLQFPRGKRYAIRIMGRLYRKHRWSIARRFVALAALVSFTIGNIGWPQAPEQPAERGCCGKLVKLSTGGGCCCGKEKQKASCGCRKALVETQTASCCQKKKAAPEKPVIAVSACRCGDASFPGFMVSSQPKLAAAVVEIPQFIASSALPTANPAPAPQRALAPETPPPRTSAA